MSGIMATKKEKALEHIKQCFEKHIGHEIKSIHIYKGVPKKLIGVVKYRDKVMLKLEGDIFPSVYHDQSFECSCGEGKPVGTNEEESE
jgi:hypothetical protein